MNIFFCPKPSTKSNEEKISVMIKLNSKLIELKYLCVLARANWFAAHKKKVHKSETILLLKQSDRFVFRSQRFTYKNESIEKVEKKKRKKVAELQLRTLNNLWAIFEQCSNEGKNIGAEQKGGGSARLIFVHSLNGNPILKLYLITSWDLYIYLSLSMLMYIFIVQIFPFSERKNMCVEPEKIPTYSMLVPC